MSDTVTVRFLFFRADIYLDRLEDMPLRNFKKLLRIAAKDTQLNAEAIQRLQEYFERTVPDARIKAAFTSAKVRHDKIIKLKDAFFDAFPRNDTQHTRQSIKKENKDYVSE